MLRPLIAIGATCAVALGVVASPASAQQPRAGAKCAKSVKVGKVVKRGGVTLRCTRTKKGKVWRKVVAPAPARGPAPTAPTTGGGAALVPSRTWTCAVGYYPYTSYQRLVTAGSTYTVSFPDGTGASSGTIERGTHAPLQAGTPLRYVGGAWDGFIGEFAPAGTVIDPGRPPLTVDSVYTDGGLKSSYYPTTCTPQ